MRKSDAVRVYHKKERWGEGSPRERSMGERSPSKKTLRGELTMRKKSDRLTVDHEKKSDGVRVDHEKERWGESSPSERAMG